MEDGEIIYITFLYFNSVFIKHIRRQADLAAPPILHTQRQDRPADPAHASCTGDDDNDNDDDNADDIDDDGDIDDNVQWHDRRPLPVEQPRVAELGDQLGQAVGHRQPWRHPPGPREGVAVDDAVLPSQGADETWWLPRPVHPQREV